MSQSGEMATDNPLRYKGARYDDETGLYYLIARYYQPEEGVFLSADPEGGDLDLAITQNGYNYATNNPVMYTDPDGNYIWLAINAGFAIYDGYKAYKTGKASGKKGLKLVGSVAWASGSSFAKIGHLKKASKLLGITKNINQVGSYTVFYKSGMKYHGKGPKSRARESGRRYEKKYGEVVRKIHWTPAKNDREAFKQEHARIQKDKNGVLNRKNYNKINSPGAKF
ncbi:hypothetical protein NCCP2716_10450 [Sporosarcina sp. NCCP-2716]|nr:hypothetical protein NCCP2716_10450 [Sporosarcina sp. NCCP-2716]